jgi:hypothetical protein
MPGNHLPVDQFLNKVFFIVTQRYKRLETALANAHGVPVRSIELRGPAPAQIWDFDNYPELIRIGYDIARDQLAAWNESGEEYHSQAIFAG